MTALEVMMREWLASGTDAQKAHARARIAIGFQPEPTPKLPSLLTRAKNFTQAVVSHVSQGMPTLDQASIDARLAVCEPCGQRLPGGSCAGCGCHLRTKAAWGDQHCPLLLWPGDKAS